MREWTESQLDLRQVPEAERPAAELRIADLVAKGGNRWSAQAQVVREAREEVPCGGDADAAVV